MAKFIVAITGGIASGKSAVSDFFHGLGITVADADIAARAVVEPGQPAFDEILARFGSGVLAAGQLNRQALRELIFTDPDAKRILESITHPRIRELLVQECQTASSPYAIVAIPLLAEGNSAHYDWISRILVVDVTREIQRKRLLARDSINEALADKMLDAQATRSQRLAIADDVICNVHDLATLNASVKRLDDRYRKLATALPAKSR